MYNTLIYFEEAERLYLSNALDLFRRSHKFNFFFGKIQFEKDKCIDASFISLYERPVCFAGCVDLDESLQFHDFLRALRFRFASL